ncbi:MAG: hypothetical protein H7Y09_06420 [Chitinophagaceae bacterium]|nr:hypothetical protein [Anaerolineae bacterium]
MLDDLRRSADEDEQNLFDDDDDVFSGEVIRGDDVLFLGMTPIERMFISIFLFMNVAVLGLALLLATGRLG